MYLFLSAADSTGAAGGGASMILMFVVLIAVFYFFMIRPENKRKKEAQQMRDVYKRQTVYSGTAQPHGKNDFCYSGASRSNCTSCRLYSIFS